MAHLEQERRHAGQRVIGLARHGKAGLIADVDSAAGLTADEAFFPQGLDRVADGDPGDAEELRQFLAGGQPGAGLKFAAEDRGADGRADVQAAVTHHAEPGMKPVSEVIAVTVTVTGPGTDPCAAIPPGTPIVFDRMRVGFSVPEARDTGRGIRVGRPWYPGRPTSTRPSTAGQDRGRINPALPGRPLPPPPGLAGHPAPEVPVPSSSCPPRYGSLTAGTTHSSSSVIFLVLIVYRPLADLTRFVLAPPDARRHYPGMIRARHRWRWLCRCTGLGKPELAAKNRPDAESQAFALVLLSLVSRLLAVLAGIEVAERAGRIRYSRARRWRLTSYGWEYQVYTCSAAGGASRRGAGLHSSTCTPPMIGSAHWPRPYRSGPAGNWPENPVARVWHETDIPTTASIRPLDE